MLTVKKILFVGIVLNVFALTFSTEIRIRLAGSTKPEMGRLEVRINGTWGTIHSSDWGQSEANVVCQHLGYSYAESSSPLLGYFGQGVGMPVHMSHVKCHGNESSIFQCHYQQAVDQNHQNDVGIICQAKEINDYHVRLRDGIFNNSGRVEIYMGGLWGSICDINWNLNDATVVCRNLDFAAADVYHPADGVGESSIMHLHDVSCLGTESGLRYCRHQIFNVTSSNTCNQGHAVGVRCLPKKDLQVRLIGSNSPNEGMVEVRLGDSWYPIFNIETDWKLKEANVVCKVLGFETAYSATSNGRYGGYYENYYKMLLNVDCTGNEASLDDCMYEIAVHNNQIEGSTHAVGVVCGSKTATDGDLRLVGGRSLNEGRLEIHHFGQWGSICSDGWTPEGINVACLQMGYASGNSSIMSIPGTELQAIHLDDVICSGEEASLSECEHDDWGIHDCAHSQDVAISCNRNKDYDVRLVGGQVASEGIVEIFYNQVWGAVCATDLTLTDAGVICRLLGFSSSDVDLCGYISPGLHRFYKMQSNCLGSEANIQNCSLKITGQQMCDNAFCIRCTTNYEDKQMRLIGEHSTHGVPVVYNKITNKFDLICDHNLTHYDKNVICRSMGFASAKINYHLPITSLSFSGAGYGCYVSNIACSGTERDVRDCPRDSEEKSQASNSNELAYIYCNDVIENTVRLVGGELPREGRLEIYHDRQWGTVCNSSWSMSDTLVVCRSMGLAPPLRNSTMLSTVAGVGPVHLTNVVCTGSEGAITECEHSDWGINECSHEADVMVKCSAQLPNWCGTIFCKEDEICTLGISFEFYCRSEHETSNMYLAVVLPILVFFVMLAVYIAMRLCQYLPVQPHKDCLNLLRTCCGKPVSNYRIVLTASDEIILVENPS